MKESFFDYLTKFRTAARPAVFVYFAVMYLFFFLSMIFINSIITFLHFRLSHELSVIEDWVFHKRWEIVLMSKFIAVFFIYHLIKIRVDDVAFLRKIFKWHWTSPPLYFWVVISFLIIMILIMGRPTLMGPPGLFLEFKFTSLLASFFYFALDAPLVFWLVGTKVTKWSDILLLTPCLALFPVIGIYTAFLGDAENLFPTYVYAFYFLFFLSHAAFNHFHAFLFLLLFVGPCFWAFGLDPLWGGSFSLLKINSILGASTWLALLMIGPLYVKYVTSDNPILLRKV
ncbi:MAG: hypothetical protein A2X86_06635 [Bdellovibrionales bacterium GWA2_49_15]|nr:MAG: hypothetical protein A2X86_06635 [Bdellovibrionales bacterium GWA2_49_15]HAZ12051.1 hypothetical protein [Bdellovibrionales bacterium]